MLTCQDLLAELSRYLDDEVSAEVRRNLEAHLAHCRACEILLDSTRKTLKIISEDFAVELSEELSSRVLERLRSEMEDS